MEKSKEKEKKQSDYLYKVERVCGNGSFGIVFQAKVIQTGETVAIKKVYQDKRYKNREYLITKELNHPNIVKLSHAFYTTGEKQDEIYLNLVMNYVQDNLNRVIRNYIKNKEEVPMFLLKVYAFQIARSLAYLHASNVIHRDIKPQNVLIDPTTNRVYLCDFGSAKLLKKKKNDSNVAYICSRYYRAPELIFGNTDYDFSIDVWSLGCVLAEVFHGKPLFQGESTVDQLLQIFRILGTPDNEQLSFLNRNGALSLQFPTSQPFTINKVFQGKAKELTALLNKIFVYEPHKRLTALEVMAHPFFDELRMIDSLNNGKFMIPQIFNFTEAEMSLHSNQKSVLKKIIPEWAEAYKLLL